jgi:hypothetical protein
MKPGRANESSVVLSLILTAAALLLVTPATAHGQQSPAVPSAAPAASADAVSPPAAATQHNLGSLIGILMVSVGAVMILAVAARSIRWPRRSRRAYYPPVLLDRLNQDSIARLQEGINRAKSLRPPTHLYERTEPQTNLVFDEPFYQTEDHQQTVEADESVHAIAAESVHAIAAEFGDSHDAGY